MNQELNGLPKKWRLKRSRDAHLAPPYPLHCVTWRANRHHFASIISCRLFWFHGHGDPPFFYHPAPTTCLPISVRCASRYVYPPRDRLDRCPPTLSVCPCEAVVVVIGLQPVAVMCLTSSHNGRTERHSGNRKRSPTNIIKGQSFRNCTCTPLRSLKVVASVVVQYHLPRYISLILHNPCLPGYLPIYSRTDPRAALQLIGKLNTSLICRSVGWSKTLFTRSSFNESEN